MLAYPNFNNQRFTETSQEVSASGTLYREYLPGRLSRTIVVFKSEAGAERWLKCRSAVGLAEYCTTEDFSMSIRDGEEVHLISPKDALGVVLELKSNKRGVLVSREVQQARLTTKKWTGACWLLGLFFISLAAFFWLPHLVLNEHKTTQFGT
jgi:hypothetical protein